MTKGVPMLSSRNAEAASAGHFQSIYLRCVFAQIHLLQCGQRRAGSGPTSSTMR